MDSFDADPFSEFCERNQFYPFASRGNWELGSWLFNSGLSLVAINKFLQLKLVSIISFYFLSHMHVLLDT